MLESPPAYYPRGWDRERMLNSGANNDREGLTDENMAVFRAGLKAATGDRAYEQFFKEMYKRELAAGGKLVGQEARANRSSLRPSCMLI